MHTTGVSIRLRERVLAPLFVLLHHCLFGCVALEENSDAAPLARVVETGLVREDHTSSAVTMS